MSAPALRLYETVDALKVVEDWILEHEDEIRAAEGALPDELAQLLESAQMDFKTKVERVALFIRQLLGNAKMVKEEEERLCLRRKHWEKSAESLKEYLRLQLNAAGEKKVEGTLATVRVQKNPPSVRSTLTPEDLFELHVAGSPFVVTVPETYRLDAKAVIESWKGENVLPSGVAVDQGESVRIQ